MVVWYRFCRTFVWTMFGIWFLRSSTVLNGCTCFSTFACSTRMSRAIKVPVWPTPELKNYLHICLMQAVISEGFPCHQFYCKPTLDILKILIHFKILVLDLVCVECMYMYVCRHMGYLLNTMWTNLCCVRFSSPLWYMNLNIKLWHNCPIQAIANMV